jgi:hypothetical protein
MVLDLDAPFLKWASNHYLGWSATIALGFGVVTEALKQGSRCAQRASKLCEVRRWDLFKTRITWLIVIVAPWYHTRLRRKRYPRSIPPLDMVSGQNKASRGRATALAGQPVD